MEWFSGDPPRDLDAAGFRLRPLTVDDVVRDFDAVVSSRAHLRLLFDDDSGWLADDHTLYQNLIDLAWHQKRHQRQEAFTYTVVTLEGARVLGCVYIDPPSREGFDAEVRMWTRDEPGLDHSLDRAVRAWLSTEWPFRRVAFPGRDISWDTWRSAPAPP